MKFVEDLPSLCPPDDAQDVPLESVCRFLFYPEGDERNFQSHHKLGRPTGNASECRAKSLSLFRSGGVPDVLAAKKTAFFKRKKICLLDIPAGSGRSMEVRTGHIDLWMYDHFDPLGSVVSVVDTTEELRQVQANGT